jgi:hypothetical protein
VKAKLDSEGNVVLGCGTIISIDEALELGEELVRLATRRRAIDRRKFTGDRLVTPKEVVHLDSPPLTRTIDKPPPYMQCTPGGGWEYTYGRDLTR